MVDRQKEFSGAGPVREGFELDEKALTAYMEENVDGFSGSLEIRQFKGGQSNPTYQLIAGGKSMFCDESLQENCLNQPMQWTENIG